MIWEFEHATSAGAPLGGLRPREAQVTRRLNAKSTISLTLDAGGAAVSTAHVVRGWRTPAAGGDKVLRAAGKVAGVQAAAGTDLPERLTIPCHDAMGILEGRFVRQTLTFSGTVPATIVGALLTEAGAFGGGVGTVPPVGPAGPPRDREYPAGKNIAEAVQQLAEVDDGFWYRLDPVAEPLLHWEMALVHPAAGAQSSASFEYGPGTVGNLSSVDADILPPVNVVMALGAGEGDAQLRTTASDTASITEYGANAVVMTHPEVVILNTLRQHARDALRPEPRRTFRVRVASHVGAGAPEPWTDFDVGSSVRLYLRGETPALTYTGRAVVQRFTVTVDADGTERLTSLDFQEDA